MSMRTKGIGVASAAADRMRRSWVSATSVPRSMPRAVSFKETPERTPAPRIRAMASR